MHIKFVILYLMYGIYLPHLGGRSEEIMPTLHQFTVQNRLSS